MTREEAIAILEEEAEFLYGEDKPHNRTAFNMAIKALSAPDREKGEWIPVSERLPEESQTEDGYFYPSDMVLTFNSHGQYGVSRYWGNRISKKERPNDYLDWMDLPFYRQDILAWQPLPEPYKAESEEDKE